jgi:hypothetical protein
MVLDSVVGRNDSGKRAVFGVKSAFRPSQTINLNFRNTPARSARSKFFCSSHRNRRSCFDTPFRSRWLKPHFPSTRLQVERIGESYGDSIINMSISDANLTAVSTKLNASRSHHENDLLVEIKVIEVRAGKAESSS